MLHLPEFAVTREMTNAALSSNSFSLTLFRKICCAPLMDETQVLCSLVMERLLCLLP